MAKRQGRCAHTATAVVLALTQVPVAQRGLEGGTFGSVAVLVYDEDVPGPDVTALDTAMFCHDSQFPVVAYPV